MREFYLGHGPFSHMFEEVVAELRPEIKWTVNDFHLGDQRIIDLSLA